MNEPTDPARPRRYRRTHAEYHWTGPRIAAFLHVLRETCSVADAARAVGITRQSAYRLRARYERIAVMWDQGLAQGKARRIERNMARLAEDRAQSDAAVEHRYRSMVQGDAPASQSYAASAQSDTRAAQSDARPVQGDEWAAQGDEWAAQGDAFGGK